MKYLVQFCVIVIFALPSLSFAAGVVPCGGTGEPACQACHFVQLGQNLIVWFIGIMASIIALIFAIGGMKMVMSGGGEGVSAAKAMMTNSVIGLIILLSAWLVVDTVLKMFVDGSKLGTWNEIQCVAQPSKVADPVPGGGGNASSTIPATGCATRCMAIPSGIKVKVGACNNNGSTCTVSSQLETPLLSLDEKLDNLGIDWQVTEAYPPTVTHSNPCHANGTCIDASISSPTNDNIKKFMDSAKGSSLRAVYEGMDCSVRDTLRSQGYSAYCKSDNGYGHITGTHFSVYSN